MSDLQTSMTVMSNIISVVILLFIGFMFYLATVMDNHERQERKREENENT
jgi:putative Mn2+ efflux pump MntP